MNALKFSVLSGQPEPLGVTIKDHGINFAVVSTHATSINLCLFTPEGLHRPAFEIPMEKTGSVWHICLAGIPKTWFYLYRVDGLPHCLLDPKSKSLFTTSIWGDSHRPVYVPLSVIDPIAPFDWEGVQPPKHALNDLIIYEMHVRGFTQHASSQVEHPGTFLGVIEKIPHLLELGVNAVELMPIHEFNELELKLSHPFTQQRLKNYWGYSTVNFFSPMQRYASNNAPSAAVTDFKAMVKALHQNGIEVILDVVFNHTAEGNEKGPVLSFKGLDNPVYYMIGPKNSYLNFSGCGNTFSCNHPVVVAHILESLRYWVSEMHVDGFRFDLASIFMRASNGSFMPSPPILEAISKDPILTQVKLIAEPWDAGGLYQVGSFYPKDPHWSEWNGKYRDSMRRFIKGTGSKSSFATRICGSPDLYHSFSPIKSINFITCHDGFTLADLVSYNHRHNYANGEDNRDGSSHNESWNCGYEGPTEDKSILELRWRQMRNFHLALMLSRGVPMVLMGDEYGHSKEGNNNTWCQDNELNWFLWDQLETNAEFFRFYKAMIHFRKTHPVLKKNRFLTDAEVRWFGNDLDNPDWNPQAHHFLAFMILKTAAAVQGDKVIQDLESESFPIGVDHSQKVKATLIGKDYGSRDCVNLSPSTAVSRMIESDQGRLFAAFNADSKPISIHLPENVSPYEWHWIVNTASPSPYDFRDAQTSTAIVDKTYRMIPYSALLLEEKPSSLLG